MDGDKLEALLAETIAIAMAVAWPTSATRSSGTPTDRSWPASRLAKIGARGAGAGASKANSGCTAAAGRAISSTRSRTSTIWIAPVFGCASMRRRSAQA